MRRPREAAAALLLASILLPGAGCAGQVAPDVLRSIDRFVETHRARFGWPGVAVSVATSDSVLLARGYGGETATGAPLTGDVPFFIGSVTKTMTALAVARLAAAGRLDLDAPVEAYLPDFSLEAPFEPRSITVRHLLHHRSGLAQWDGHDRTAQEQGRFDHIAPVRPPGGEAEYSSLNFIVLGRVIEAVAGEAYGAHLERILFDPLGMDDAFVEGHGPRPPERTRGHVNLFGLDVAAEEPAAPPYLVPAGFVAASARDMARYGGMLLGGGAFGGVRVLDPETVGALFASMDGEGPAMAWGRQRVRGALALSHAGNARTSSARVRLLPERGWAVTVLVATNTGPFFDASSDLVDGIHAILEGEPAPSLWPRERLFKGAILLGTLVVLGGMLRRVWAWHRAGRPVGLDASWRPVGRLALDVGGAAFLIFVLPRLIGVPLHTLVAYFPDIGAGVVVSAVAGVAGGLLRAFTGSGREGRS